MFEGYSLGHMEPGDEKIVTFTQKMNIHGGQYLLSIGCTRFEGDELKVFNRLYDIICLSVVSEKDTVGFYDMNSKIEID